LVHNCHLIARCIWLEVTETVVVHCKGTFRFQKDRHLGVVAG
jgi:hypothetical protein